MAFCSNCGKPVSADANFCSGCGAKISGASAQGADNGIKIVGYSDPLFRIKCEYCFCEFEYRLKNLDYRPWYPSGFVYCPKCEKPLRHHNRYEVK